jgi:pyruvate formate lyase activating enzyme
MSDVPLVVDIKHNSLDDGPGIRSVIFLKGCPLRCRWCQNPESQKTSAELLYEGDKCIACGTCIDLCPEEAISLENTFFVDRIRCSLCFQCTVECPSKALSRIGSEMSIATIVSSVARYRSFFETSGGGVTISGGEPTVHVDFLSQLLQQLDREGFHVLLETCGWFDFKQFEKKVLPYLDTIYYDIKIIDPHEHKRWCGVTNKLILDNFRLLSHRLHPGKLRLLPRTPLIPGITDTDENILDVISFYRELGIKEASLLENNPIWKDKLHKLGLFSDFESDSLLWKLYNRERFEHIKKTFAAHNIEVIL